MLFFFVVVGSGVCANETIFTVKYDGGFLEVSSTEKPDTFIVKDESGVLWGIVASNGLLYSTNGYTKTKYEKTDLGIYYENTKLEKGYIPDDSPLYALLKQLFSVCYDH